MEAHQQRVVDEHADLEDKIAKLGAFIDTEFYGTLHDDEKRDLLLQHKYMMSYWTVLTRRIQRFTS